MHRGDMCTENIQYGTIVTPWSRKQKYPQIAHASWAPNRQRRLLYCTKLYHTLITRRRPLLGGLVGLWWRLNPVRIFTLLVVIVFGRFFVGLFGAPCEFIISKNFTVPKKVSSLLRVHCLSSLCIAAPTTAASSSGLFGSLATPIPAVLGLVWCSWQVSLFAFLSLFSYQ